MRTETREVHFCDHCGKRYLSRYYAERHEERCTKNPANDRPCFHCPFFVVKRFEIPTLVDWHPDYEVEPDMPQYNACFCTKKEHGVYPPQVPMKNEPFEELIDLDTKKNYPNWAMPKSCTEYEEYVEGLVSKMKTMEPEVRQMHPKFSTPNI